MWGKLYVFSARQYLSPIDAYIPIYPNIKIPFCQSLIKTQNLKISFLKKLFIIDKIYLDISKNLLILYIVIIN